jgi:pyrroloquinoline quinone (PQQ) biosynthesis protein C
MSFFDELAARTAAERTLLHAIPQIQDGLAGRISRETYIAYLTEAYHHVRHTVPLMQATKARLDDRHAAYRDALDTYIAEETGHEAWILNDIAAAGGDRAAAADSAPRFETELMVAYAYDFVSRIDPMGFFGMVYVLEGTSTELATRGAEAVRASLDLPASAFSYLKSHGVIDLSHIAFLRDLINSIDDGSDRAAIVHMARGMFRLYAGVFSTIPHRTLAHAL